MIVTLLDLPKIRQKHQNIVLVGGCYDLIHVRHVKFLEKCKKLGDILVVTLSSDVRVLERKGKMRPIIGELDRQYMVNSLEFVDFVLISPESFIDNFPPTRLVINALRPEVFATNDMRFGEYSDELEQQGIKVVYVEPVDGDSTSNIIQRICSKCTSD
ncbi:MAG: hypothetical protein RLZZ230_854 [Candidatus Parcubacteria bacterium]|jgi:D-beta-D-heptose 7-phosphate kinase/D-beta-D-heptose 1-phosphate adenosyltransferase